MAGRSSRRLAGNVTALRPLWSTTDVAACLAFSARTVRRWRANGTGPGWFRVGRLVRYDPAEVYRWLHEECEWSPEVEPPDAELVAAWRAAAQVTEQRRRQQKGCRGQLRMVGPGKGQRR